MEYVSIIPGETLQIGQSVHVFAPVPDSPDDEDDSPALIFDDDVNSQYIPLLG